jgi:hypothetical protein
MIFGVASEIPFFVIPRLGVGNRAGEQAKDKQHKP